MVRATDRFTRVFLDQVQRTFFVFGVAGRELRGHGKGRHIAPERLQPRQKCGLIQGRGLGPGVVVAAFDHQHRITGHGIRQPVFFQVSLGKPDQHKAHGLTLTFDQGVGGQGCGQ